MTKKYRQEVLESELKIRTDRKMIEQPIPLIRQVKIN